MISFAGTKLITLSVCNATSCTGAFTTVLVSSASPPGIEALICKPNPAVAGKAVTCTAFVFDVLPGATWSYVATGATPGSGAGSFTPSGVSFQITFPKASPPGSNGFSVTFTACHGGACASDTDVVLVQAPGPL